MLRSCALNQKLAETLQFCFSLKLSEEITGTSHDVTYVLVQDAVFCNDGSSWYSGCSSAFAL